MEKADSHLEASLEELNGRVNALEADGDERGLVEAYLNRGCVLAMMGDRTSAMDDLMSASELADGLGDVDPGTFVKIHCEIADLLFEQGADPLEEYSIAITRLDSLNPGSFRYDRRSVVRMCLLAAGQLIDSEHPDDAYAFIMKGLSETEATDPWSQNRRLELFNIAAEADDMMNDVRGSVSRYSEAVEVGTSLLENGALEDTDQIVLSLAMRASGESDLGMLDNAVADLTAAVGILEGLLENHSLPDTEPLISLHHDLAGALMKSGRIEEAEKHLIRAMEIGIGASASDLARRRFADGLTDPSRGELGGVRGRVFGVRPIA